MIARKRSDEIDKQLDALAKERPRILKILLLGAGESGKLTIFSIPFLLVLKSENDK